MGEIIKTWLRTRLGVIIDLRPEIFGRYSRDGTLLAKILHSYDIINESQLSTLIRTEDPALSRVNLKHLRSWLRFIGVDCDARSIEDISNAKGTVSLRLFYKVFLSLENKDRLHFVTQQKEREKFIPNSTKFYVTTVSEEPDYQPPDDHPFAAPLMKSAKLVEWYKEKYKKIIEGCKEAQENYRTSQDQQYESWKSSSKIDYYDLPKKCSASIIKETERKGLDEFARDHRVKKSSSKVSSSIGSCRDNLKFSREENKVAFRPDPEAAKAYTKSLKKKRRQTNAIKGFQSGMQTVLLSELWEQILNEQEMEFDEIIARKVLKQSEYEKQLMHKLCDIRREKTRMAENRKIVEELVQRTIENEEHLEHERAREIFVRESEEIEAEFSRINELQQRISQQIERKTKENIRNIVEEIVRDLIDISVKAGEHKIAGSKDSVPKSLWNEWKALFLNNQPIFETINPSVEEEDQEIDDLNSTRTDVLNNDDFENYKNTESPWADFIPSVDVETQEYLNLGQVVLGYIVHKLLLTLYPYPSNHEETALLQMKIRAVVVGIPDSFLFAQMQKLLSHSRIHIVRMEDAINYCLEQFKMEIKDPEYIDSSIVDVSKESLESTSSDQINSSLKNHLVKKISHRDTNSSRYHAAYIGKWIHQFLTLGEPISDELNAKIIVEYLKSLRNIEGFVLVNYPNTHRQMSLLELALSGRRLLENRINVLVEREETNIEDIDPVPSRISFESIEQDLLGIQRQSRLVPNPIEQPEASNDNSYLTAFVRVKRKPKGLVVEEDDKLYEIISSDASSLDAFYVYQDIAWVFYYTAFDLSTMKRLVRLVVTANETPASRRSSIELFGEALEYFKDRENNVSLVSKAPIVKKLLSKPRETLSTERNLSMPMKRSEEKQKEFSEISIRLKDTSIKPGETEWQWANLPQPLELVESLAKLWQSLETRYIQNLKDTFYLKRTNLGAIVPYANFITGHMKEFIERPDDKQDILHKFHRAFNDIDADIREDIEVKHELHCRVADLQLQLWEICDRRRLDAEEERKIIILDHWTALESIVLTNVYIGMIQAEIDRYTETLQLIQDYYMSMLQRPLQKVLQSRIVLEKIALETPPVFADEIAKLLLDVDQVSFDPAESSCCKNIETNIRYAQNIVETIAAPIMDTLKKEETLASKAPIEIKDIKDQKKRSKESLKKESRLSKADKVVVASGKGAQDLYLEWRYAISFEINRIRIKLNIFEAMARCDIKYLIDNMRRTFHEIHRRIIDRYKSEVKSVNEMALTFRLAIEEATQIQEEMLLDGDRFLVRSNVLMFPDKQESHPRMNPEEISPSKFQMAQLGRLMDIFRRLAPDGTIAERSFVYILQDLVACPVEDVQVPPLPSSWFKLRSCDAAKLVKEIFGDVQFIDWREFIVHAMDIDAPSVEQILQTLEMYRKIDKDSKDVISYNEFLSAEIWFINCIDDDAAPQSFTLHEDFEMDDKERLSVYKSQTTVANQQRNEDEKPEEPSNRLKLAKELLCEMFSMEYKAVNYVQLLMAFCKDEIPERGLRKALSLAMGSKICMDLEEGENYAKELVKKKHLIAEAQVNRNHLREEATKASRAILDDILNGIIRTNETVEVDPIVEATEQRLSTNNDNEKYTRKAHIEIELLDTPTEFLDPDKLLLPKDESPIAFSSNETTDLIDKIKIHGPSIIINPPEENDKSQRKSLPVYWLNLEFCKSVIAKMLPNFTKESNLFGTGMNLEENLDLVFSDLRNEEQLNDEIDVVLAHRFFHHDFIKKLSKYTFKFTTKHLGNLLDDMLRHNK